MARPNTTRFVVLVLILSLAPAAALSPAGASDRPNEVPGAPTEGLVTADPPALGQEAKFPSPNPQRYAVFGWDVGIAGDTFVASAPWEDYPDWGAEGAVYVFERGPTGWSLAQRVVPPDETTSFGKNLAFDGDTLLVADIAQWASGGARSGAVYAYEKVEGRWVLEQKLEGQMYNAKLGAGLAVQGDTAFLGARPNHEVTRDIDPRTHVYERSNGTWNRTQTLPHGPTHGRPSIGLSNDTAVMGDNVGSDKVYVYGRSADGWQLSTTLEDPTPGGASGYTLSSPNGYGWTVDLHENRIIVGEFNERSGHVFARTDDGWDHEATLHPPGGASAHSGGSHSYGLTVTIEDDLALVGARTEEMMAWQTPRLTGTGIVGERGIGSDAGAVYAYERTSEGWAYDGRLTARDAGADDSFGNVIDVDGDTVGIGAYGDDHGFESVSDIVDLPDTERNAEGAAYVFSPDADHDDVADRAEGWLGLEVHDSDTDGDGIDDGTEVTCGWDPHDPSSLSPAGETTGPVAGDPVPLQDHKWWMCKVVGS